MVYLRKITSTLKVFGEVNNHGHNVIILYCDIVQLTIFNAHFEGTIFPFHEQRSVNLCRDTRYDEYLIYKIFQLLFQFLKLGLSHFLMSNKNVPGILNKIDSIFNFPSERKCTKICWRLIYYLDGLKKWGVLILNL